MDLTGILSVSGHGGLFKLIKQSKTGFIVESLIDQKRMQAFASSKISTLEDIAIYTETGEVQLKEVFRKIFQRYEGKQLEFNAKSTNEELKAFMEQILPDYDKERVYVSDIRKLVLWFNLLNEKGLIDLVEDKKEEEKTEPETTEPESSDKANENEVESPKPAKKKVKKIKDKDIDK